MTLALVWMLKGAVPITVLLLARRASEVWHTTRRRVMTYPGPYALATYRALQSMRWAAAVALVMGTAAGFGWGGAAIAVMAVAIVMLFVTLCTVGLLLPMIAVAPARRRDSAQSG